MSEVPPPTSDQPEDNPVEQPTQTAEAETPAEGPAQAESLNETLTPAPERVPSEVKNEPETAVEEPTANAEEKMLVIDYIHELDPEFITEEIREELDRQSGLIDEEPADGGGSPLDHPDIATSPYDTSITANEMREIIYGSGDNPGLKQNMAALLILKKPEDFERMLLKAYYNEKEQLENAISKQYADLVALAEYHFNNPAKYEGPVIQNSFQAHSNKQVTMAMIIDRLGLPEESSEPDEIVNPSRIPARN